MFLLQSPSQHQLQPRSPWGVICQHQLRMINHVLEHWRKLSTSSMGQTEKLSEFPLPATLHDQEGPSTTFWRNLQSRGIPNVLWNGLRSPQTLNGRNVSCSHQNGATSQAPRKPRLWVRNHRHLHQGSEQMLMIVIEAFWGCWIFRVGLVQRPSIYDSFLFSYLCIQ